MVIATDLLVVVFASLVSGSFSGYFIDFQVIVISPCLPIKWLMRSDVFKFVVVVLLLDGRWNMQIAALSPRQRNTATLRSFLFVNKANVRTAPSRLCHHAISHLQPAAVTAGIIAAYHLLDLLPN